MATINTNWVKMNEVGSWRIRAVEDSQNITNNTTTVTLWVDFRYDRTYNSDWTMAGNIYPTFNGTRYVATLGYTRAWKPGDIVGITNKTITVTHNTDGTKTIPCALEVDLYGGNLAYTAFNITLTPVPRASSFSVNVSSVTLGSTSIAVTINRASSSFTHKVFWSCNSGHNWQANSGNEGATTVSWTPSIGDSNYYTKSTSGSATIKVETYSGGTRIGTATKTVTVNVPSSVVPSISSLAVSENGGSKISGVYVKGKSKANVQITASGSYGSTISSYSTSITGFSPSTSSKFTTGFINTVGTVTFTTTVKDTRGRTATKSTTINVLDYQTPKFSVSAYRCLDDGTEDLINGKRVSATFSLDSYSDLQSRNVTRYTIYVRRTQMGVDRSWRSLQSGIGLTSPNTFFLEESYTEQDSLEIKMEVTDLYGTYEKSVLVPAAYALVDFKAGGKGVAFGTIAVEDDKLDTALRFKSRKDAQLCAGWFSSTTRGDWGTLGYCRICRISIMETYPNGPIEIHYLRRGDEFARRIIIRFNNENTTDPGLAVFKIRNCVDNKDAALCKVSPGVWDLYVLKKEGYDEITTYYKHNIYNKTRIKIDWTSDQIADPATLPECLYPTIQNSEVLPARGRWWANTVPEIGTDGVMEVGKFLDFHLTNESTTDYDARLRVGSTDNIHCETNLLPGANNTRLLGNTYFRWQYLNLTNAPNVSSDRNMKENIEYIKNEKAKSVFTDETITYNDMYNFVKDDLELATYNFKGQEEQSMNFIAQDLLYNLDGTDNKIGQMIVNPIAPPTEEEIEEAKSKLEEGQEYEYPTLNYDTGMYISVLAGALKNAINEIETLKLEIKELRGEK